MPIKRQRVISLKMPGAGTIKSSAQLEIQKQSTDLWSKSPNNREIIYSRFRERYKDLPDQFALDCFRWDEGEGPTEYQLDCMTRLIHRKRLSVRAPHGAGKTGTAAIIILWFILTRDRDTDWKIPTTASAWRQLTKYLWPEIHKWAKKIKWDVVGREPFSEKELLNLSIKLETGEAFALASNDSSLIEGAHASELLYVFDEAKTIPEATWDSAEGAFSSGKCMWLAISTPGAPEGRFYDIQRHSPGYEDWDVRHITLEECIRADRIPREWSEGRKRQWGAASARYKNRVLGEFAASEEDAIIPLEWIELANERWLEWQEVTGGQSSIDRLSVDVARSGMDKIVYAYRSAYVITECKAFVKESTMQTASRCSAFLSGDSDRIVIMDVIGVGAGPYDKLMEEYPERVFAFNSAKATDVKDRSNEFGFTNMRSAAWWKMRELLDPANNYDVALPDIDELTGDLSTPKYMERSGGKIQLETKDSIRLRIGRSTNYGDAIIMAFWEQLEQEMGMEWA